METASLIQRSPSNEGAETTLFGWFSAPIRILSVLTLFLSTVACSDSSGDVTVRYLDAPPRPEDIVQATENGPAIVSAIATSPSDTGAGLYLIDTQSGAQDAAILYWDPENASETFSSNSCGLTEAARIAPHGIAIDRSRAPQHLFVVTHAPVEAVLVYDIKYANKELRLTESSCIAIPQGVFANAVTGFGSRGLAITKMFDPRDGEPFEKFSDQEVTGSVLTWSPAAGWQEHPHIRLSGPNGILWDEHTGSLIVAEWARRRIVQIPAAPAGGQLRDAKELATLPYMPDNLRWSAAGTILTTGQASSIAEGHDCITGSGICPTGFEITSIDIVTGNAKQIALISSNTFGMASVAAPVNDRLWIGSVSGNQIAEVIVSHPLVSEGEN